jgi:hypothetical protein
MAYLSGAGASRSGVQQFALSKRWPRISRSGEAFHAICAIDFASMFKSTMKD